MHNWSLGQSELGKCIKVMEEGRLHAALLGDSCSALQ